MPTIIVMPRTEYGVERIYPVCENAQLFAMIAGQKTLTLENIKHIQALGYKVLEEKPKSALYGVLTMEGTGQ